MKTKIMMIGFVAIMSMILMSSFAIAMNYGYRGVRQDGYNILGSNFYGTDQGITSGYGANRFDRGHFSRFTGDHVSGYTGTTSRYGFGGYGEIPNLGRHSFGRLPSFNTFGDTTFARNSFRGFGGYGNANEVVYFRGNI